MTRNKCLMDGCDKEEVNRGLCMADYSMALRLVKDRKTTWEALEKTGRAKRRELSRKRAWFLDQSTTAANATNAQGSTDAAKAKLDKMFGNSSASKQVLSLKTGLPVEEGHCMHDIRIGGCNKGCSD